MTSVTSSTSAVTLYKGNAQQRRSGKGPQVKNYYKTDVTSLVGGGIKTETFRTDANGNNTVKIKESQTDGKGNLVKNEVLSTATKEEKRELNTPNSRLTKAIKNQVNSVSDELDSSKSELDKASGGSGNSADTPPETGDTSTPSSEPPKNRAGTRDDFGAPLHYPVTRDEKQDIIKFDMLKYEPKKIRGFGPGERDSNRKSIGTVTLPIPGGISDANACNWGDDTMGPLQLAAAGAALEMLTPDGSTQLGGVLGNLKSQLYTNNTEMKQLIQAKFSAAAVGADANSLFGRTQGMILNPNLELLFQGPSLRPFTFQFKMSPRSSAEAKVITQIIRFFKQGMAPIREDSRLFLKTPHTFRIKYVQLGSQEESKFLNKFKECALLSCSIQYTPEGNYAPYEDGAMSSYQMSLQFKELEPVYNDNYGDDPEEIGF